MVSKQYQEGGIVLGKIWVPILAAILLIPMVSALQVTTNPATLSGTVTKSNPSYTFTATITLETNETSVVVLCSNPQVGVAGPIEVTTTGTYTYTLYFPVTPGTYAGTLTFKAFKTDGSTTTVPIDFSFTVSAWELQYEDFFEKGVYYDVEAGTQTHTIKIKDIGDGDIVLYADGDLYTLSSGDDIVLDNLKVEASDIFSSGAVLKLYTQGEAVTVTKKSTLSTTGDTSGFTFTVRKWSKYVEAGMTFTVQFTLVNNTDQRVELKDVYFENTTVTPEGEKPTRLQDYSLPAYLDPGQEVTFNVIIDTRGLTVGQTYTPTLVVTGKIGDTDVRATVDFTITVVQGVQSQTTTTTTTTTTQTQQTQTLKNMVIEINPPSPKAGDLVTVYAKDPQTNQYINATITVNGQQTQTFTAEYCKTYRITATATGYATATKTVTVPCRQMVVTYTPDQPVEGNAVTFSATDAETGDPITNITVKVDGKVVTNPWIATAGRHIVVVSAEGYSPKTITLVVKEIPATVVGTLPEEVNVGSTVTINLSKEASWEVYDENGYLIASGTSSTISFQPEEPGKYTIKINGKEIGELNAMPVSKPPQLPFNWGLIALVAVVIYIGYRLVVGRKPKAVGKQEETPIAFELRPKPAAAQEEGSGESS